MPGVETMADNAHWIIYVKDNLALSVFLLFDFTIYSTFLTSRIKHASHPSLGIKRNSSRDKIFYSDWHKISFCNTMLSN